MNKTGNPQAVTIQAHNWQQAASSRRSEAARQAGIRISVENADYQTSIKRNSKRKSTESRVRQSTTSEIGELENVDNQSSDRRGSMKATRVSTNKDIEMFYHKPVQVKFNFYGTSMLR